MSSEGHIEGRLVPQRRWIHPSADEEAGTTAEEHSHHQQQPEVPEPLDGQRPHTAPRATAVFIRAAYEVDGVSSLKVPAVLLGFYHLQKQPEREGQPGQRVRHVGVKTRTSRLRRKGGPVSL